MTYSVRHQRGLRVPLRDGSWLAADLFMPEGVDGERFPAVLEYLPYRKNDNSAGRWDAHFFFAEHGYVGVRLDVRGTGDSPGVATDEYTPQEQIDGVDAIAWLAAQPWSNGRVGLWGTSYGGFNAIQIAMHRPPALRAIVPHAATDDRYSDDMHQHGGCLAGISQMSYPLQMVAANALPPDPRLVGDAWQSIWQERLRGEPWMLTWLREQVDGPYWRQGSLRPDYGAIECPVLNVGGWADAYANAAFRMAERLPVESRTLVGPWTHRRPNVSTVGPRIGFMHEVLRWWDRWLKDEPNGVENEPPIAIYVQDAFPPDRFPKEIPGRWRYESEWPPARTEARVFDLGDGALMGRAAPGVRAALRPVLRTHAAPLHAAASPSTSDDDGIDSYEYDPTVGTGAGFWCPTEKPHGMAGDQRRDDARSLCYDGEPLAEPLEILGVPRVFLRAESSAPVALFVAKLCDVWPDGRSTMIARGWLNGTRRASHEEPEPMQPGEVYELEIPLRVISYVVPAGHRLRLSVSSSDFPTVWPTPYRSTNRVHRRGSRLELPTVPSAEPRLPEPRFEAPEELPATTDSESLESSWETVENYATGYTTVRQWRGSVTTVKEDGTRVVSHHSASFAVSPENPAEVRAEGTQAHELTQGEATTEVVARGRIDSTEDTFEVQIDLLVRRDGGTVAERSWRESIPRRLL